MKIIQSLSSISSLVVLLSLLAPSAAEARTLTLPFGTCQYSGECINLRLDLIQGINQEYLDKKSKFLKDSFCEKSEGQSTYDPGNTCGPEKAIGYCGPISGEGTDLEPGLALVIVYSSENTTPKDAEKACRAKGGSFSTKDPYASRQVAGEVL